MNRLVIEDFQKLAQQQKVVTTRYRVATVCGNDDHTLNAIMQAIDDGFAEIIFIDQPYEIVKCKNMLSDYSRHVRFLEADSLIEAAEKAVDCVREGEADCIMKGLINTDILLKAVLNKQKDFLSDQKILTHITAMKIPTYNKMLFVSDAAVIPYPKLEQRVAMIKYAIKVCEAFNIMSPRIALIHCTEKVSPKFPITEDYMRIKEMASHGEFGNAIIDGPMDLKCACNKHAAMIKGIDSEINGEADVLIMPDIEAANAFYKAMTTFVDTELASVLQGAKCPIVLTSRSDSTAVKYNSLSMACISSRTNTIQQQTTNTEDEVPVSTRNNYDTNPCH